ncbi:hypothetical protein TTHERM_00475090 (macronuclear) [Tetrahymena thermophila SB210]|uniref:Uncharacterized protein n=1 Tax=Tetrahymena thermophila (strain SB210) TaxID=312017 RepID=I7MHY4_TETTS|nr:hypothetical protein TTHERM_00475090 [Tetrahymena thermophila SB210]EAS03746.1 hypothetical protein TTHERM_00475090 [Tetrahymena thermophila SB210]|eukprot:XP_001023991.1 hypothetical protein TTHERM_00475090 [Tetrahymena thermophila SB210]
MGNNCNCIGKTFDENVCQTQDSNGSVRIQAYPNRKIFDDHLSSRRFTLEPIKSSSSIAQLRSESTKRSANVHNHENFSLATEAVTVQSGQQNPITFSIFQSSPPRRQNEHTKSINSNCSPINSNRKRSSKIFSNPQSTAIQTPCSSRNQTIHENYTPNIQTQDKILLDVNHNHLAPPNLEKAEWSLSPVISPRSKFFSNKAAPIQKTFDGVQCDMSEVIDFKQQQADQNDNKSSFTTNVFEIEFTQNSELEIAFKELENKQKFTLNHFAKITELTLEDDEEDTSRAKEQKLYTSTIREQTSLTYSDSSICNISSLTPEQMQIVKSKYQQFESSNSDKSTQIFDNQSYNYAIKIINSRDQVFSPQRLSTVRASDSILSETIKRNSNPKNNSNLVIA